MNAFDPGPGRKVVAAFLDQIDVRELTWAWSVVTDCLDVIGHHSTPPSELRRPYVAEAWLDWYGSFLFDTEAQHTVHGLAREFRDACPSDLAPALRRTVEDAFRACDQRTPQEKAAVRAARAVRPADVPIPSPAPVPHPFTVLAGGKE